MAYRSRRRRSTRRKSSSARTPHRRRRVGAMALNASSPMVKYGSLAAGFLVIAKPLNTAIDGLLPASVKTMSGSPKIVAAAEAGLGALLFFGKGKKSLVKTLLGAVMLGAGVKRLMDSMATGAPTTITGYGAVDVISGYGKVNVVSGKRRLNGYTPNSALSGYTPNTNLGAVKPVHQVVMGSANSREGSGYME